MVKKAVTTKSTAIPDETQAQGVTKKTRKTSSKKASKEVTTETELVAETPPVVKKKTSAKKASSKKQDQALTEIDNIAACGFKTLNGGNKKPMKVLSVPANLKDWVKLPILKDLKVTIDEAIMNYSDCSQIVKQEQNPCQPNHECLYGGFHVRFERDQGILRTVSYECPYKQGYERELNYQHNFWLCPNILKNHRVDMLQNNLDEIMSLNVFDDKQKLFASNFHKTLRLLFDKIQKHQKLCLGMWCSGPVNTGKTYNMLSLCNSLAKSNYSVIYIDNWDLISLVTNFDRSNEVNQTIKLLKEVDVLVIDNFGMESSKNSYYYGTSLINILEDRNCVSKMTVFASNYNREAFKQMLLNTQKIEPTIVERLMARINNLVKGRAIEL